MQTKLNEQQIKDLKRQALLLRKDIVTMIYMANSGHPGGSLSALDIILVLYSKIMKHNPKNPYWNERDRFILSKGHACPALYVVLAELGYFSKDELWKLRKAGSTLQGHTNICTPGVEASTGSLGQGLSIACGMALASKMDEKNNRVYCVMGDGETNEGQVWEAAMSCAHYKLDNLCAVIDHNKLQIDGKCCDIMNIEPVKDKWSSFGWYVIEINGHSVQEIFNAFNEALEIKEKPTLILAHTTKGKGVSFMENQVSWHGKSPKEEEYKKAMQEIDKELEKI